MTLIRTPVREKAKYFCKHLKVEKPDYNYLRELFRHIRKNLNIEVESGNFMNRKELLLTHIHYGVDLDVGFANETLRNLYVIWKRPVNLKTIYEDKEVIFHFDGKEFRPQH